MTKNDIQEFYTVLSATIMLIKPEFIPTKQYMDFYFLTLEEFSISDVKTALTKHIQNPTSGMYIPKPADLMKYLRPATQNNAEQQWAIVLRSISSCGGRYGNVFFEDKITNTIVHEMNWANLCNMSDTAEPFERKRFIENYGNYANYAPRYEAGINYGICHNVNVDKLDNEPIYLIRSSGSYELTDKSNICTLLQDTNRAKALESTLQEVNLLGFDAINNMLKI